MQTKAIERGEVYELRAIKRKRKRDDNEWEYLCTWKGYDDESWETAETLRDGSAHELNKFNENSNARRLKGPASKRKKQ